MVVIAGDAPHTHNLSHLGIVVFLVLSVDTDLCDSIALHLAGIEVARRITNRRHTIFLVQARLKPIDDGIWCIACVPTTLVSDFYCSEHRGTADDFRTCLKMMPFIATEPRISIKSPRNSTKHVRGPWCVAFAIAALATAP